MFEIANGPGAASANRPRIDYYNRLLKSRGGNLEAAGEGPPDLSDPAIQERLVETGATLHRIVTDELGDRPELHGIVDRIVASGDTALRVLRDGDEERLRENPSLVRDLEVIVKTDGSRPSFMIRNGAVDSTTSPVGSWQATLDDQRDRLQRAIACVGRIDDPGSVQGFQGTGFLVGDNLIVTNRHVLQAVATRRPDGAWEVRPGVTINFGREHRGRESVNPRALKRVVFAGSQEIDPYSIDHRKLDLALIEIEPVSGDAAPEPLAVELAEDWSSPGVQTFIVGYPGEPLPGAYQPTLLEELFRSTFGFKRLAPGAVLEANGGLEPWTVRHDCTTLGGNSGSVVLVTTRSTVAAGLHYGGGRGVDDEHSENWGHILGRTLDVPGDGSDKTLRERFTERGVTLIDSLA